MKNSIFYIVLFIFIAFSESTFSQENVEFNKENFNSDIPGFQAAEKNIKNGDKSFLNNNYEEAIKYYLQVDSFNPDNDFLNYKLGYSFLATDVYSKSLQYLKKARSINSTVVPDINFLIAKAYHLSSDFEKAIIEYKKDNEILTTEDKSEEIIINNILITECKNGIELNKIKLNVKIEPLDSNINTKCNEYGFFVFENDTIAAYTKIRDGLSSNKGGEILTDEQVVFVKTKDNTWENFLPINFNTQYDDGIAGVSPDGKSIFIYKGKGKIGNLFVSKRKEDGFSELEKLPEPINSKASENSISITEDGKTVYFVSNRAENNIGEYDKAIPYFQAVSSIEGDMAQNANYHLAICYVKTDKKAYALEAFKEAYMTDKDASITEDALFNFAKLSYELDYNPYKRYIYIGL